MKLLKAKLDKPEQRIFFEIRHFFPSKSFNIKIDPREKEREKKILWAYVAISL